jgi:hypothetical protein
MASKYCRPSSVKVTDRPERQNNCSPR